MKPARLYLAILVVFAFAVVAGWRIVGQMQAERYAQANPERALGWRPDHPQALLVLAVTPVAAMMFRFNNPVDCWRTNRCRASRSGC